MLRNRGSISAALRPAGWPPRRCADRARSALGRALDSRLCGHPRSAGSARRRSAGEGRASVDEARWLEAHGCDAIIAQGAEAGGHRGSFLGDDPVKIASTRAGTMALVPQVVDAVKVPVIAAGGIADARGIVAALPPPVEIS